MTRMTLLAECGLLCLALCACGGGGRGGVASIPPPPVTQPPPVTGASVSIFPNPVVGEFASAGVSAPAQSTGNGGSAKVFGPLSNADADQVHLRYTSGGLYEIQMPGAAWDTLTIAKGVTPADPSTNNSFQPASAPQNGAFLSTSVAKLQGYQYSEMANWRDGTGRFGELAFGEPTLAGQMPSAGAATYHGMVSGASDVIESNFFDGPFNRTVNGSVDLSFDFGKGTLAGAMTVSLGGDAPPMPLGTFAFTDTVFSVGSTTYSGKFDTTDA